MNVLIDTCVILDVLQNREPFAEDARQLFLAAANEQFTGCISAKSATDVYYLTHRLTHDNAAAKQILQKLFTLFTLLDTAGVDCERALLSPVSDYEDAVMVETAKRCGMDGIVTRNTRDYGNSPVPVYTPGEFCEILEKS